MNNDVGDVVCMTRMMKTTTQTTNVVKTDMMLMKMKMKTMTSTMLTPAYVSS